MINSVYSKTMEDLRKRISVKVVNNEKDFLKHISKPTFIYAAIDEIKPVLTLSKPIYRGFTVLELSQLVDVWIPLQLYQENVGAEFLFTDTDSLTYKIKSENVYEEFFKQKHLFHLSNYPKVSEFFDPVNEKVFCKMKDVSEGKLNGEFDGLKSQMHSMKNIDGKESNRARRVNIATKFWWCFDDDIMFWW